VNEIEFTKRQRKAIETISNNQLIIAGPGTGKTEVITSKIKYLIEEGSIDPNNILAITFTKKAALEMLVRVLKKVNTQIVNLNISTIHSFCNTILKDYNYCFNIKENYRILDDMQNFMFVYHNYDEMFLDDISPLRNANTINEVLHFFNKLKNNEVEPDTYLEYFVKEYEEIKKRKNTNKNYIERITNQNQINTKIAISYKKYNEIMHKHNFLDYNDIILEVNKELVKNSFLRDELINKYKYILVDEYQDTNYTQNKLIRLLQSEGKNYVVVVGDDDQSIYRFRGAKIENIIKYENEYCSVEITKLLENHRSTRKIVKLTSDFIITLPYRIEKNLNTNNGEGFNVEYINAANQENEAEQICKKIFLLLKNKDVKYLSDIAILLRSVRNQSIPYINLLDKYNIPYQVIGKNRLFEKEKIKKLFQIFKAISGDEVVIEDFDKNSIKEIIEKYKNFNYKSILEIYYDIFDKECLFSNAIFNKQKELLYELAEFSRIINDYDDIINKVNIKTFLSFLYNLKNKHERETNEDIVEENKVRIMTIHQAKGLEFKIVFIPDLIKYRFPVNSRSKEYFIPWEFDKTNIPFEKGDLQLFDEMRLFYVALTRAKDLIVLSSHKKERNKVKYPSRFLDDVKENIVEKNYNEVIIDQEVISRAKIIVKEIKKKNNIISFTRLLYFILCPLRYQLNFEYKFASTYKFYFAYGISIHHTLANMHRIYKEQGKISKQEIKKIFEDNWISKGYSTEENEKKFKDKALSIVLNYYSNNKDQFNIIDSIEKQFILKITDNYYLKGYIDLIYKDDDRYKIIDFKTGEINIEKKEIGKFQLLLYALGCTENYKYDISKTMLYDVANEKKYEFEIGSEELLDVRNEIEDIIKEIDKGIYKPRNDNCKECEFYKLCPYSNKSS